MNPHYYLEPQDKRTSTSVILELGLDIESAESCMKECRDGVRRPLLECTYDKLKYFVESGRKDKALKLKSFADLDGAGIVPFELPKDLPTTGVFRARDLHPPTPPPIVPPPQRERPRESVRVTVTVKRD